MPTYKLSTNLYRKVVPTCRGFYFFRSSRLYFMPDSSSIVSKVWNYAHVLKNAGVGYGDYVEQITYPDSSC